MVNLSAHFPVEIVFILTVGFVLATLFGYITERLKLPSLLGYLLAGYLIGPYSPGFVANVELSEQLAEIGVILMMFWVGLHLKLQELFRVKYIAIVGAIAQTLTTSIIGVILMQIFSWSLEASLIIGFGLGIASTMALIRVLQDNELENTRAGHIALGWLICEDFLAVIMLIFVPVLASIKKGESPSIGDTIISISLVFIKFVLWFSLLVLVGRRLITFILNKILKTKRHELFTLAILAITFFITVSTSFFTGTSIALGAFLAGALVGQTRHLHQIAENLMPMRDTFVVFFFLSIGMLFNPIAITKNAGLFFAILGIILVAKPLIAGVIVRLWQYKGPVSVTVALALAQIGEFSFILAEEANKFKILPDDGYDILVACAFVSLAINPLLVKRFGLMAHVQRS